MIKILVLTFCLSITFMSCNECKDLVGKMYPTITKRSETENIIFQSIWIDVHTKMYKYIDCNLGVVCYNVGGSEIDCIYVVDKEELKDICNNNPEPKKEDKK